MAARRAAVGAILFGAAILWTLVAAGAAGGNPFPQVATLAVAAALTLGIPRLPRARTAVPGAVLAVTGVLVLVSLVDLVSFKPGARPFLYANANAALFLQATAAGLVLLSAGRQRLRVAGGAGVLVFGFLGMTSSRAALWLIPLVLIAWAVAARPAPSRVVMAVAAVGLLIALAFPVAVGASSPQAPAARTAVRLLDPVRPALWRDAWDLATAHPVTGVGPGRFDEMSSTIRGGARTAWAHDEFLQAAAETGFPGAILLVAIVAWAAAVTMRVGDRMAVTVGVAAVALGIQAAADYVLHFPLIPWTAAALVGAARPSPSPARPGRLVRQVAKAAVLPFGLLSRSGPGDVVILSYHRIGEGKEEIELSSRAFESQLAQLAAEGIARPLREALADGGGVVVTFDDGYRDFHHRALPLLVRYRIPALLYLATGLVGSDDARFPPLSWSELEEAVSTRLVTIGSHTHDHAHLGQASEEEARAEMQRSKDLIEDRLGVPCVDLAYPFGVGSPGAERAARELFETAALTWGTNRAGRIDPYRLARTPVLGSDSPLFFSAKLRGMLDGERALYRLFGAGPWRPRQ
jgi:peptidoglycan/xylan/chitin deacetylase (PgdA/CDA1 family)/O-antigen ligase